MESNKRAREDDECLRPKRMAPVIQGLSANSLVALKAQLHRTEQQVKTRQKGGASTLDGSSRRKAGVDVSLISKAGNSGVEKRDEKDRTFVKTASERLDESRMALEQKALLYEQLAQTRGRDGSALQYEVDFESKAAGSDPHTSSTQRHSVPTSREDAWLEAMEAARPREFAPPPQYACARTSAASSRPSHREAEDLDGPQQRASPTYEPYYGPDPPGNDGAQRGSPTYEAFASGMPRSAVGGNRDNSRPPGWHSGEGDVETANARREMERQHWAGRAAEMEQEEERLEEQRKEQKKLVREVAAEAETARAKMARQKQELKDKGAAIKNRLLQQFVAKQMMKGKKPTKPA